MIGTLGGFDGHGNMVVLYTVERMVFDRYYCDLPIGLVIVRGEEVVVCGELDPTAPELPSNMILVTRYEMNEARKAERNSSFLRTNMRRLMNFLECVSDD
ncbi:hypothetical protein R1flu_001910 [Riccia fluitans]|uniref:Sm domain-containing protein n=1 Tax=Riccia fluitans TaxID=41844 RepID=A0ABD1Y4M5_9MARC